MTLTIAQLDGVAAGPLVASSSFRRLCRKLLFAKLGQLRHGCVSVVESGAATRQFGDPESDLRAMVRVEDALFYPKAVLGGSIGAAEAYIAGAWHADDLTRLLRIFVANRTALDGLDSGLGALLAPAHRAWQWWRSNSRAGSRRNIHAHYDLGNEFFGLFLDRLHMYSSAIFPEGGNDGLKSGDDGLELASEHKLDRLCRKLELGPSDHLLEIGSGWGGLAVYAATRYGCRVTTTTISREQYAAARELVERQGLQGRVEVLLEDYRDLRGSYDKLVSVEMIEAVGHEHLGTYFAACAALLRPHGLMALQAITLADRFYDQARRSVDFIQRYIFPGSAIPSMGSMLEAIARHSDLQLIHSEEIGPHYARTLRAWRHRFFARLDAVKAQGFSDAFIRLWDYYLCYCEAGFLERAIGDVQWVLAKPENRRAPILGDLGSALR